MTTLPPRVEADQLFWISFASDEGCLGVCIVSSDSPENALARATKLSINPGGEAYIIHVEHTEGWPIDTLIPPEKLDEKGYARLSDLDDDTFDEITDWA